MSLAVLAKIRRRCRTRMSVWSVVPRLSPDPTRGGCFVNIRGSPSVDKEAGERMSLYVGGGVFLDFLVVTLVRPRDSL